MEFGGGLGIVCETVARLGKRVTYLDVPGRIAEFAQWRFRKHNLAITTLIVEPGQLGGLGTYDIVFTDAVLEHLPPSEQDRMVRILGQRLHPGGLFVLPLDPTGPTADNPTHTSVDLEGLHLALEQNGLQCREGRHVFWSLWTRPGESPLSSR